MDRNGRGTGHNVDIGVSHAQLQGIPLAVQIGHGAAVAGLGPGDGLLPAVTLQQIDWAEIRPAEVAELVWTWGISTGALSRRLKKLELTPSAEVAEVLTWSTQKLLRRHWTGAKVGDPITRRMRDAGERRFPTWLQEAHLEQIAEGAVGKGTLAWMLGVPVTSLEVDEPAAAEELSDDALAELIG